LKDPKVAYVLHWFPEPSETFIFNEVHYLHSRGLDLRVFTLYGALKSNLSPEMVSFAIRPERLGMRYIPRLPHAMVFWRGLRPGTFHELFRHIPCRRWSDLEMAGEFLWGFFCGFELARRCVEENIAHIHAPWANGPATAAWVASLLSGIPFSFAAHATDIYPPDGALAEKISASCFVRTNNQANVEHLSGQALSEEDRRKITLVYNGHPVRVSAAAKVVMEPPFRLLAVGRFVRKKGFDVLLKACQILKNKGLPIELTLAGDGPEGRRLKSLSRKLGLGDGVAFPGFVPYERVPGLLDGADVFIMPSIVDASGDRDGLPNVIMEALLQKVPVVATNVCGIAEVIRDGVTGFLVPQNDPLALAHAIVEMTRDRDRALRMAQAGHDLVVERFAPDRCFNTVRELLERGALVGGPPSAMGCGPVATGVAAACGDAVSR
jgi:glycosyltransferase involved in cell wall biosynthesis